MKIVKTTVNLFLILIAFLSKAQVTFQKHYGGIDTEMCSSMCLTNDGGYVLAGWTQSYGQGAYDIYIIKTDSNGDTLWTRILGTPLSNSAWTIKQTNDLGFIISGNTSDSGTDMFVMKLDSAGNMQWSKALAIGSEFVHDMIQTTDDGYIIVGMVNGIGPNNREGLVIKMTSAGNITWTKAYGAIADEEIYSILQHENGNYTFTGFTGSFGANPIASDDGFLTQIDSSGNLLWTKTYGGANSERIISHIKTDDGGFVLTGFTYSFGQGALEVLLIKTDSTGNVIWTKTYGGTGAEEAECVIQTSDGGFALLGFTESFTAGYADAYIIKTDSSGNLQWSKNYGGTDTDHPGISYDHASFFQTNDGGYVFSGETASFALFPQPDIYLVKTDSMGITPCNYMDALTVTTSPTIITTSPVFPGINLTPFEFVPQFVTVSDGLMGTYCSSVGIADDSKNSFLNIFPNPSSGIFTVSMNELIINSKIEIFDLVGNKIYEATLKNTYSHKIELNNLSDGIYLVKLNCMNSTYFKKLLVSKL